MPFRRVQRRGFISFDSAFKKGNLEPSYLSGLICYQAPTPPSDHSQTGLRDSPGSNSPTGKVWLRSLKKVNTCFLTGKCPPSPGTPAADTGSRGRHTGLSPHWLFHLPQVTAPLGLGFSSVKSLFFLEFLQKIK